MEHTIKCITNDNGITEEKYIFKINNGFSYNKTITVYCDDDTNDSSFEIEQDGNFELIRNRNSIDVVIPENKTNKTRIYNIKCTHNADSECFIKIIFIQYPNVFECVFDDGDSDGSVKYSKETRVKLRRFPDGMEIIRKKFKVRGGSEIPVIRKITKYSSTEGGVVEEYNNDLSFEIVKDNSVSLTEINTSYYELLIKNYGIPFNGEQSKRYEVYISHREKVYPERYVVDNNGETLVKDEETYDKEKNKLECICKIFYDGGRPSLRFSKSSDKEVNFGFNGGTYYIKYISDLKADRIFAEGYDENMISVEVTPFTIKIKCKANNSFSRVENITLYTTVDNEDFTGTKKVIGNIMVKQSGYPFSLETQTDFYKNDKLLEVVVYGGNCKFKYSYDNFNFRTYDGIYENGVFEYADETDPDTIFFFNKRYFFEVDTSKQKLYLKHDEDETVTKTVNLINSADVSQGNINVIHNGNEINNDSIITIGYSKEEVCELSVSTRIFNENGVERKNSNIIVMAVKWLNYDISYKGDVKIVKIFSTDDNVYGIDRQCRVIIMNAEDTKQTLSFTLKQRKK